MEAMDRLQELLEPHGFQTFRRSYRQLYHEAADVLVTVHHHTGDAGIEVLWARDAQMVVSLPVVPSVDTDLATERDRAAVAAAAMILALVEHLQTARV